MRLAMSGVPEAMCSTAGNENPSYSEGTTAISALAASSASSVSLIPCTNRTRSPRARSLTSFSVGPPAVGEPTTMSWPSRSTVILAKAWSSVDTPLSGESALATATIRPGTRGCSRGWNSRVSTPSGITCTLAGSTPKSRQMSAREACEAVRTGPTRRATRPCIRTKEYQRHLPTRAQPRDEASSIRRSTLIGWWMLVTRGRPSRASPSIP